MGGVHNKGGLSGLARFQTMSSAIQAVLEVTPLSISLLEHTLLMHPLTHPIDAAANQNAPSH